IGRRILPTLALVILAMLCLPSVASAQSTDPDHPAPLGPGVNRGNVDNSGRGHTFFFFAGPGHIDVDMAFEEMGLFGSPLRQTNFDFSFSCNRCMMMTNVRSMGQGGGADGYPRSRTTQAREADCDQRYWSPIP